MSNPPDGVVEHLDGVLTDHARAIERLCPRDEDADVQTALGHREWEGEPER